MHKPRLGAAAAWVGFG